MLGPKKFWVQKILGPKKILVQKRDFVQKVGTKKLMPQKLIKSNKLGCVSNSIFGWSFLRFYQIQSSLWVEVWMLNSNSWWLSIGWWVTIQRIAGNQPGDGSCHLVLILWDYVPNSKSIVHFLLVDFGRWVTILGMVADHPLHFTWS